MGRVLTNNITLSVAPEVSLGTQPVANWKIIEPTSIGKYGPTLTKITREPISKNRQHRKGALTDLDSSVEFEVDITYDHLRMFAEGLMFAVEKGNAPMPVSAVTATGFTVAVSGSPAAGTLLRAIGFTNPANNGLKVVGAGSTGTEIKVAGLVVETGDTARGAYVEIAGVQLAAGDGTIDASGNLKTTTFDWTAGVAAGLQVGQFIYIGDGAGSPHSFFTTADAGLARIKLKAAGLVTLDKKGSTFTVDDGTDTGSGGTGLLIRVYFGNLIRNVPVDSADYLERTFQFELAYENLGDTPGTDKYEYAKGNFANQIDFDFQVASKATMKCAFVGTDTDPPTTVRATGAATATPTVGTVMYNTSTDFMRLRVTGYDETGLTTDLKSATLTLKNNVSPEKVLGTLGGKYMNAGLFDVTVDAKVLFTDSGVLEAMRNNATVTMEIGIQNDDGGFVFDIPAMTLEGGDKEFPINQTVNIAMKTQAFQDPNLGTSASISTFAYLPAA